MQNPIFRKAALDRLSSPEELDQLITVTRPGSWIALLGLFGILLTGIFWGFAGSIGIEVSGIGMITASEGVANVIHPAAGTVSDVRVKPGDHVKKGDVIARLEQNSRADTINSLKKDLELARAFEVDGFDKNKAEWSASLTDLYEMASRIRQAKASSYEEQYLATYKQMELNLQQSQLEASRLEKDAAVQKALLEAGVISRKEYEDALNRQEAANMQLEFARQELQRARLDVLVPEEQQELEYLREQLQIKKSVLIADLTNSLNKAVEQMQTDAAILSQVEGRILEVNIEKGNIIQAGVPVASIMRDDQTVNSLEVVLYVSPEQGKKVIPGMDAHISPSIIKKEDYGYMLGKVTSVSEYPLSVKSLVQVLGNQELANRFAGGSAPIEVRVNLIPDSSTFSGFEWSTSKGPEMKIDSGNICSGSIVIENRKPVGMVLPYFKQKLNLN